MLELARGVGLGVDIGYLLELQRALEPHGVVEVAADEEHGIVIEVVRREVLYVLDVLKHLLHLAGKAQDLLYDLLVLLTADRAERVGKVEPQHIQQHELGAVRLCSCNGDLWPGPGVEHIVRLPGYGAADDVDYRKYVRASRLCLAQRRHRVERFARLADDDDKALIVDERVAVTEFRGEAYLDRLAHEPLEIILSHHTDMI